MSGNWKLVIPWVLSLATIAAGIWQYADKQAHANREPFLRKQLELVFEASDTVATLATATDSATWSGAHERFWMLYHGSLAVVEDTEVEACMVVVGNRVPEPGYETMPPLPMDSLEQISLNLAYAARELILASWDVKLEPLEQQAEAIPCTELAKGGSG